ncbi:hypothetical protein [Undibacterium sp. Di24W]|uniref:hypothetical protein n=1 Tax=Undibacterium sp. Di24W TaxID=3413033 RepID=UPI003BF2141A
MTSERNQRIAAFRKVSGYLLWVSMPLLLITSLCGLSGFIYISSIQTGEVDIHQSIIYFTDHGLLEFKEFAKQGLSLGSKIFFALVFFSLFIPIVYILFHVQRLIQCFYNGDIFNARALSHARKAYKLNLYWGLAWLASSFIILVYCILTTNENYDRGFNWIWDSIAFLIELGFLSLILWALEIGTNLNEEAELTI